MKQAVILENNRVRLVSLQADDKALLLPYAINEPELWKYSLVSGAGKKNLENYIKLALKAQADGSTTPFIVWDKETNQCAGSTRYYDINLQFQSLSIGYTWYGKDFHGTGLNKNCKYLLLQHAFETMNMERVEFRADANNERSIYAMKSIGCKVEGVLRQNMPTPDGPRRDSIVLSILKNEWYDLVKEKLEAKI